MPWAETKTVEVVSTVNPLVKETLWISGYPDSLDRWTTDLAKGGYSLTGEYEVDATHILYRFELDEAKRGELVKANAAHFHNVVIEITPKEDEETKDPE